MQSSTKIKTYYKLLSPILLGLSLLRNIQYCQSRAHYTPLSRPVGITGISCATGPILDTFRKYSKMDKVIRVASENGVVIFSKSSCCLCYTVNILFQELGVTPFIYEVDKDPEGKEMEKAIMKLGCNTAVPAVFIGGKLMGSTNEVMSLHLRGSLTPMLKPYQGYN